MAEWDYEKNDPLGLDPSLLGCGSHAKAWWKCKEGHSWYAMAANRAGHNRGCPYCAHQLPIPGETDLATLFPDLAAEWHPKNPGSPDITMPGTHKKVWWICSKGHEYEVQIISRTSRNNNCPYCSGHRRSHTRSPWPCRQKQS